MIVVLDTNVLVSGLLTPFGSSGEVVRLISSGTLIIQYDSRILIEYEEILHRPKFRFDKSMIDILLDYIKQKGQVVCAHPLKKCLPDADDKPFLEVAMAGKAECLITGNKAHFPRQSREGVKILSPAEFIDFWLSRKIKWVN